MVYILSYGLQQLTQFSMLFNWIKWLSYVVAVTSSRRLNVFRMCHPYFHFQRKHLYIYLLQCLLAKKCTERSYFLAIHLTNLHFKTNGECEVLSR